MTLRAGAARVKITPAAGLPMAGYAARGAAATGVHDDLYARALALSSGGLTAVLLVLDVLLLGQDFVKMVRQDIAQAAGIPGQNVIVVGTHTHSGPAGLVDPDVHGGALARYQPFLGLHDPELCRTLRQHSVQVVEDALRNRRTVRVAVGSASAPGLAGNRRRADGLVDRDVVVVRLDDEQGQRRVLIFSQGCHPTVLGPDNSRFSGDLVGLACQRLEAQDEGLVVMGLTGAAGDVSTRSTRRASTFEEAERLSDLLAGAVKRAAAGPVAVADGGLQLNSGLLYADQRPLPPPEELERRLAAAKQALEQARREERSPLEIRLAETAVEGVDFLLDATRRQSPRAKLPVEISCLEVGPAVLLMFPVELFAESWLLLRERCGRNRTLIACYANGYLGYAPPCAEYVKGGYEADMAILAEGSAEEMLAFAWWLCQAVG